MMCKSVLFIVTVIAFIGLANAHANHNGRKNELGSTNDLPEKQGVKLATRVIKKYANKMEGMEEKHFGQFIRNKIKHDKGAKLHKPINIISDQEPREEVDEPKPLDYQTFAAQFREEHSEELSGLGSEREEHKYIIRQYKAYLVDFEAGEDADAEETEEEEEPETDIAGDEVDALSRKRRAIPQADNFRTKFKGFWQNKKELGSKSRHDKMLEHHPEMAENNHQLFGATLKKYAQQMEGMKEKDFGQFIRNKMKHVKGAVNTFFDQEPREEVDEPKPLDYQTFAAQFREEHSEELSGLGSEREEHKYIIRQYKAYLVDFEAGEDADEEETEEEEKLEEPETDTAGGEVDVPSRRRRAIPQADNFRTKYGAILQNKKNGNRNRWNKTEEPFRTAKTSDESRLYAQILREHGKQLSGKTNAEQVAFIKRHMKTDTLVKVNHEQNPFHWLKSISHNQETKIQENMERTDEDPNLTVEETEQTEGETEQKEAAEIPPAYKRFFSNRAGQSYKKRGGEVRTIWADPKLTRLEKIQKVADLGRSGNPGE